MIRAPVAAVLLPIAVLASPAAAQDPLGERAQALLPVLNGGDGYADLFTDAFKADVPPAKFKEIAAKLATEFGRAVAISALVPSGPDGARLEIAYERGLVTVELTLEQAAPYRIAGLRVTGTQSREATLGAVEQSFATLPGVAGLAVARLGTPKAEMLADYQSQRPLAIASAFKLVVLAELVRQVNAGERRWRDPVILDGRELPSGQFSAKPAGTRATLAELARAMISVSDNSATDVLIRTLGRERIEAMMPRVGIAEPWRNQPLLQTLEAFKLKGAGGGRWADRWATSDPATRREMLRGELAGVPAARIDPALFEHGPNRIDSIEWFASPADLVRVMDWLRRNTAGPLGAEARAILSINPGVGPEPARRYRYLGYKGGSETGVMNMTFLLQTADGVWYAASAGWNNGTEAVDEARFAALLSRALTLISG